MNEDSMSEQRVHVKEVSTGKILRGEDAPLASELEAWLEKNPGYEEVPRDEDSEDDSDDEKRVKGKVLKTLLPKPKRKVTKQKMWITILLPIPFQSQFQSKLA